MNKYLLLCISFWLLANHTFAQTKTKSTTKDEFNQEFSIGGGMLGRGFNVSALYGIAKKPYITTLFNIDFVELKSPNERRRAFSSVSSSPSRSGSSYVYGKRNNFYALRLGYGRKHYISEKKNDQSITLAFSYQGGLSFGLLKPYYLDLIYHTDSANIVRTQSYTAQNEYLFLDPTAIEGAGGFALGWDDLTFIPGAFTKASVWVDFGADESVLAAIELGISVDYYPKRIPIMVRNDNAPVFFNVHANIHLGGRWRN